MIDSGLRIQGLRLIVGGESSSSGYQVRGCAFPLGKKTMIVDSDLNQHPGSGIVKGYPTLET